MKTLTALVCLLLFYGIVLGQPTIRLLEDADFLITGEEFGYLKGATSAKMNDDSIIFSDSSGIHVYSRSGEYRYDYVPIVNAGRVWRGPEVDAFGNLAVFGFHDAVTPTDTGQNLRGRAFVLNTETGEQLLDLSFNHVEAGIPDSLWGSAVSINDRYVAMGQPRGRSVVHDVTTGEEVFRFIPDTIDAPKSGDLDLFDHYIGINSPDAVIDGVHSPGIFLFDILTGEQLLKIDGSFSNVELGDDRVFIRSSERNAILGYDFSGELVSQFRYETLGKTAYGEIRDLLEYEAPFLIAPIGVFAARDLSPVIQTVGGGLNDIVGSQAIGTGIQEINGVGRVPFLASITVPEPAATSLVGIALLLMASRPPRGQWRLASSR